LTEIPVPLAEAVQGLLALTWTVWAPPSAENARFSGVTVRTGSGVVLHPKSRDASPQSRMGKRRFIIGLFLGIFIESYTFSIGNANHDY
jgi:hypothetical protein